MAQTRQLSSQNMMVMVNEYRDLAESALQKSQESFSSVSKTSERGF